MSCHICHFVTGVHNVTYAFPKVRICTTAVDNRLDENFYIVPGIGESLLLISSHHRSIETARLSLVECRIVTYCNSLSHVGM